MADHILVRDYFHSDQVAVVSLFAAIYPLDPGLPTRMAYDPGLPNHVTTKLAFVEAELVGQANIFRFNTPESTANLGYHVHPQYRRRGIALQLGRSAMATATQAGIERFVVRTVASNEASIAVALRLGFEAIASPPDTPAEVLWFQLRSPATSIGERSD